MVVLPANAAAGQLALFHGGKSHMQEALDEVAAFDGKVTPLKSTMMQVDFSDENGVLLEGVSVEIRFVRMRTNTNARVQLSALVLHGVDVEQSNAIVGMLDHRVKVTVQRALQVVKPENDLPEVGQLVTGLSDGISVVGICTEVKDDRFILNDFGIIRIAQNMTTAFFIESTDETDVEDHLANYKRLAEGMGETPSCVYIVDAMAICAGADQVKPPSGTTGYINEAVMGQALLQHTEDVPEAGEG